MELGWLELAQVDGELGEAAGDGGGVKEEVWPVDGRPRGGVARRSRGDRGDAIVVRRGVGHLVMRRL